MIRGGGSDHCADFISCLPLPPNGRIHFLITYSHYFYSRYFIYYCVYFLIVFIVLLHLLSYCIYL